MIKELWYSDWQLKCQICLLYVYFTSKLDFYILDVPASNRLIIKQGVSEFLNFSTVVEHLVPFISFKTRCFEISFVDSFGSWCITGANWKLVTLYMKHKFTTSRPIFFITRMIKFSIKNETLHLGCPNLSENMLPSQLSFFSFVMEGHWLKFDYPILGQKSWFHINCLHIKKDPLTVSLWGDYCFSKHSN